MNAADNKKLESDVVVFTENASRYETENTMLAALLLTLGVSMKCTSGSVLIGSGARLSAPGGVITWQFEPKSEDGRFRTEEVIKLFGDKNWLTDPENESPLAYVACAFHNYKRLLDFVKSQVPLARHPQGEKEGPGAVGCGSVLAGRGGGFSWRPAFNLT